MSNAVAAALAAPPFWARSNHNRLEPCAIAASQQPINRITRDRDHIFAKPASIAGTRHKSFAVVTTIAFPGTHTNRFAIA